MERLHRSERFTRFTSHPGATERRLRNPLFQLLTGIQLVLTSPLFTREGKKKPLRVMANLQEHTTHTLGTVCKHTVRTGMDQVQFVSPWRASNQNSHKPGATLTHVFCKNIQNCTNTAASWAGKFHLSFKRRHSAISGFLTWGVEWKTPQQLKIKVLFRLKRCDRG